MGSNNVRAKPWMRYICHQKPDRCFKINGKAMPICSRCTGVYFGLIIGFILPLILTAIYLIHINIMIILMMVGLGPMALDGFTQFIGLRKSNNYLRFITGFLCGIFLGMLFNWLIVHILFLE